MGYESFDCSFDLITPSHHLLGVWGINGVNEHLFDPLGLF